MEVQDHPLSSVRIRRQYASISSVQMADRLGVKRTSYLRFERGERRAFLDQAYAIASMLGCTVLDLARLPSPEEVKSLYARAQGKHTTEPDEPAGAQQDESEHTFSTPEPEPEPEPDQPIGLVVDAHDAQPAATAPANDTSADVAALVETWDNE